jgi:hypothetical protein
MSSPYMQVNLGDVDDAAPANGFVTGGRRGLPERR